MTNRRTLAATSLAGIALVALSACQGTTTTGASSAPAPSASTSTGSSAAPTSASPKASTSGSASASPKGSSSASPTASGSAVADATSAADFAQKFSTSFKALKTFEVTNVAATKTGTGDKSAQTTIQYDQTKSDEIKTHITGTDSEGGKVDVINIGKDAYTKQASGKYQKGQVNADLLSQLPALTGELVAKASDITKVGTEKVESADATHYTVTYPAGTLGNADPMPVEYWVDKQFRPVKIEAKAVLVGNPSTTTMTFSKYDQSFDIKAPAASEVE